MRNANKGHNHSHKIIPLFYEYFRRRGFQIEMSYFNENQYYDMLYRMITEKYCSSSIIQSLHKLLLCRQI